MDERGVAWLQGTRTKVIEVVLCQRANHLTAVGVQEQYEHLSLEQITTALSYYQAHREEIDKQIEERRQWVREFQKTQPKGPTREELLARLSSTVLYTRTRMM